MSRSYAFGEFLLEVEERRLLRNGQELSLPPKVFDTLLLLVEKPGHLVTKDEFMNRLWPDTFVGEDTLAQNISILRKVLGGTASGQDYVATVPKRGYRFVAPLVCTDGRGTDAVLQAASGPATSSNHFEPSQENQASAVAPGSPIVPTREPSPLPATRVRRFRLGWVGVIGAALVVGSSAGVTSFLALSPMRVPRVVDVTQITRSGRVDPWRRMVSDGSRIYFLEREGDHWNLMQTSVEGGQSQIVAAPFRNTLPLDISPDRSEFLIASFTTRGGLMPLWIWPAQGGPPQRVGEVLAYDARWFGGRQIVYAKDDGLYAVERDGSGSRLIAATEGRPSTLSWSPDGRRLRFTVDNGNFRTAAIWEMDADGKHLHRLFPGRGDPPHEENGVWLSDRSYYIFGKSQGGSFDLWATQERASFLHRRLTGPMRLTAGPEGFTHPIAARGKLLAFGSNVKTELVRYDPRSRQFATLLVNQHPWRAIYSRDGQWVVYISPNGSLRKIKADGTEELSLTAPPLETDAPAWSPDGKQVAFRGRTRADQVWKLYVASAQGGTPREVLPSEGEQGNPGWSPDGRFLAFGQEERATSGTSGRVSIQALNLETNQASQLPDSQGKTFPSWSPDGHFLAALSGDEHKLMLFDLRTQSWSQVSEGDFIAGELFWSGDSKFLYFQDLLAPNEPVYRLRMDNRKVERVASFEVFLQGGVPRCGFQGLTPDGALLVVLLRNHADIYALSLDLP